MWKSLSLTFVALGALSGAALAKAGKTDKCPDPVKAAIAKAFPAGAITSCKAETEHGKRQFEVNVTIKDARKLEVDVSTEGAILQSEEVVKLETVPQTVMKAFAAKYPKAKPTSAEKQTHGDGKISYEVAFKAGKGKKEVTFTEDGNFVEEE